MSDIQIYDTTLRDGTQGEEIAFSLEDKLAIAQKLAKVKEVGGPGRKGERRVLCMCSHVCVWVWVFVFLYVCMCVCVRVFPGGVTSPGN